jgi:peptidoglycan/LPS O-acetylase OafA/YrhL
VLVGAGAALLAAAAAIAVYSRSGMLDALHSGLFDHCGTGPLYCTRPDTGLPVLLDTDPLKYLGMLNIALPVLIGVFWGAPLLGRVRGRSHTLSRAAGTGRRRTVGGTAMALAGHRRGLTYPFYLVHQSIGIPLAKGLIKAVPGLGPLPSMAVSVICMLGLAALVHTWVERRLGRLLRQRLTVDLHLRDLAEAGVHPHAVAGSSGPTVAAPRATWAP